LVRTFHEIASFYVIDVCALAAVFHQARVLFITLPSNRIAWCTSITVNRSPNPMLRLGAFCHLAHISEGIAFRRKAAENRDNRKPRWYPPDRMARDSDLFAAVSA
jgi:hypothetical protein